MKLTGITAMMLTASVFMSMLCCGCTNTRETRTTRDDGGKKTVKELPEDEVLIISGHHNAAWGYQSSINYVMSDGSVYSSQEYFDGFPDGADRSLTDEERLAILKKYTLPVTTIDKDQLLKIYNKMINIDPDAKFIYSELTACDAGTGYTKVNVDGDWVKISEDGDQNGELDDRYARKTNVLIDSAFKTAYENRKQSPGVYSGYETFIGTFECPKTPSKDTKRIITNIEELKAFEKDTGIDLRNHESFEYFDGEYSSFEWCCIAVEVVTYPQYLSLDDVSADAFVVADNYVGFAYLEDPVIDVSEDVVPQKSYCHVVQLPGYNVENYDLFLK